MDISAIALQGLNQADTQFQQAAIDLANVGSNGYGGDIVDLASVVVALSTSQISVEANLSALKAADQIQQAAINLTA
jgi:hypothetical protein